MHDELIYAERAMRAGASGYIMKQEATEKVLVAIRRILQGKVYLSDRLTNSMLQHYVRLSRPARQLHGNRALPPLPSGWPGADDSSG